MTVGLPMPAPKRNGPLPPAFTANIWKPGQSGNPTGNTKLYGETVKLAREAAPAALRRLIELMSSDDERVASVASNAILDRAWGRPRDFDPASERPPSTFNPRDYSPEELDLIEKALRLMLGRGASSEPEIIPPVSE
jgi:hypothetical protein